MAWSIASSIDFVEPHFGEWVNEFFPMFNVVWLDLHNAQIQPEHDRADTVPIEQETG